MKISLCIPQYNRIQFLLKNLSIIEQQTYADIEVVISDDASTDDTEEQINTLREHYKYPIIYQRHPVNVGYDKNLRTSLELGTGEYCITLGNDDTLNDVHNIADLVEFLQQNNYPEIGFCNYVEAHSPEAVHARAPETKVIGSGLEVALKFYRSFSYVAGIIIRKSAFDSVNTDKADGSVFVQMYFAARVITTGGRFFTYAVPMIVKDIRIDGSMANSYRDTLMRSWKDYKPIDGGIKQVIWAVLEGFKDAGANLKLVTFRVLKNIYQYSFPYWLIDYRSNGSFVGATAMMMGLKPSGIRQMANMSFWQRLKIRGYYYVFSTIGMLVPIWLFNKLKMRIYTRIKK
jgi:glycosyltransferase involved in cell wall biosynthesis